MDHMRLMRAASEETPDSALVFMASTPGTKRDGLDTAALPWRVDNYRLNPVVTWSHDFAGRRLPIGRGDVEVLNTPAGEFVRAAITFDSADPFAAEVERKYREGFLHAVSVSWDDVGADGVPVRSGGRAAYHELLEIAAVPVPGDPLALQEKRGTLLRGMARDLIDALESADDDAEPTTADDANALAEVSLSEGQDAADADADGNGAGERVADADGDIPQIGCYFSEKAGCECVSECAHPDQRTPPDERAADTADDDAEDEGAGDDLAAEMVAVFDPESDDSDAVRGRRYRALLPGYRRMGWTAPELLPADELAALDGDVWRGMFVSGELERLERVGKEISAANLAGLKDALAQLESGVGALKTMVKRVDSGTERAADDGPTAEDIARAIMDSMTVRITNELG